MNGDASWRSRLADGVVIPAHPLALTANRTLDERRQSALTRYYAAAGAGGIAVGVHTTQFEIRQEGLYEPVLELAGDTLDALEDAGAEPLIRVAGVTGPTAQAVEEAGAVARLGYHLALVSLGALPHATTTALIDHIRAVAAVMPVCGFYLQIAAGGRPLGVAFWQRFVEIENVVAIKIAPFNRYDTLDVVRAVAESGRADDIALYTGNDDHILLDLLTPFHLRKAGPPLRIVGGLLGHWAIWTRRAVAQHAECRRVAQSGGPVSGELLTLAAQVTDANAAVFDPQHRFAGCLPGIHEVLRRQGLLEGTWCLDETAALSPGQSEAIDRVWAMYPHLRDDRFIQEHLDDWLR